MIRRLFPAIYLLWLAICAMLFIALSGMEDPSRPEGRILSLDAGTRALGIVQSQGARSDDYEVVHVARARKGEGGPLDRWIVLLDRIPHTGLRESVVVELGMEDGRLLAIRKPATASQITFRGWE